MVHHARIQWRRLYTLSVLALSSRFDGLGSEQAHRATGLVFQYSLCRVVLMVSFLSCWLTSLTCSFSTRSVESF